MKRLLYLLAAVLVTEMLLPMGSMGASILGKKSVPQVPITYQGDTDKTILRRAKWIEGAKKEGALTWWGSLRKPHADQIVSEFNKIYPFIKVDFWAGSSGVQTTPKVEAEFASGRKTLDLLLGGDSINFPRWRKMGMFERFTDIIPGIEKIDKKMYSRFGDWFTPGAIVTAPQYNTRLVSAAEAPKSWDDLLNPKWKGQMGLMTDAKVWYVLALGDGGWGIEKTEDFLRKITKQNPIWQQTHISATTMLGAGEFKIYAAGYVHNLFQVQDKGAPIDFCRVNPVTVTGSNITFHANAPHPNAARLLLEWLLSPQGLTLFEKVTSSGAVYPGAQTRVGRAVDGLSFLYRTEEIELKVFEMGLDARFKNILGATSK